MGTEIEQSDFTDEDYRTFDDRLRRCLEVLRSALGRPGFGRGPMTLGAELELALVDPSARPALDNERVIAALDDPRFTLELCRYNLEFNARYTELAGRPLSQLEAELADARAQLQAVEPELGTRATPIGILPTLQTGHLRAEVMSDRRRYRVLNRALRRARGGTFQLRINGAEPLEHASTDVTPEGAATSWQWHLRVDPDDFPAVYNTAQLTLPLVVALSSNSPLFIGHRLWHETRVALFKQAVDSRPRPFAEGAHPPARVSLGPGWLEGGVDELFAHEIASFVPLMPNCHDEEPEASEVPALHELRLHNSTVWLWNRPVYDPACGGHVRIEQRALPAGPTVLDMLANTALSLGLIMGLREGEPFRQLPFGRAESNFYRAAQHGIEARVAWPTSSGEVEHRHVRELVAELMPRARAGLASVGIEPAEIDRFLAPIEGRLSTGQTGAVWQLAALRSLESRGGEDRAAALRTLTQAYHERAISGEPVHTWSVEP